MWFGKEGLAMHMGQGSDEIVQGQTQWVVVLMMITNSVTVHSEPVHGQTTSTIDHQPVV